MINVEVKTQEFMYSSIHAHYQILDEKLKEYCKKRNISEKDIQKYGRKIIKNINCENADEEEYWYKDELILIDSLKYNIIEIKH